MTVEVETPEGVKSGYAVREISLTDPPSVPMLGEDRGSTGLRGEAVIVDVTQSKALFALLTNSRYGVDYGTKKILRIFNMRSSKSDEAIELWPAKPISPRRSDLYHDHDAVLPMLVTFGDVRDPTTVRLVNPHDLSTPFGSGVSLSRVKIEATDESVTEVIGDRLDWLGDHTGILMRTANWQERRSHPERFQTVHAFVQGYEK